MISIILNVIDASRIHDKLNIMNQLNLLDQEQAQILILTYRAAKNINWKIP